MQPRDIVVIGGSAGSIEPLKATLGSLPADFPASIFVVVHLSADYPALLENQLSRWSFLPASHPADTEPIRRGHIYVARPDFHLTVEPGRIRLLRGARENRHRPAIDPLFRTAARIYGPRVIGIVLSGRLDDGSTGLYAIKQRGGLAIVQDPSEAAFAEMPQRALAYANPQYVLRSRDIASSLVDMVGIGQKEVIMPNEKSRYHADSAGAGEPEENLNVSYFDEGEGIPSVFACPECHGVLWELKDGEVVRFRCRVGHSYGSASLAKELSQASEGALWAAMRALEEKAAMQRRVADALSSDQNLARRMRDQSSADDANARLVRDMIFERDARVEPEQPGLKKSA